MADVKATDFTDVMNIDTSAEDIEFVLDLAIDALNVYGADLSNMTGDAGDKTVSLTSKERGGVFIVAREIYEKFYQPSGTVTTGSVSVTVTDLVNDTAMLELLEKIGSKLSASSVGVAFIVGEAES
jgi:hypothetical protein